MGLDPVTKMWHCFLLWVKQNSQISIQESHWTLLYLSVELKCALLRSFNQDSGYWYTEWK